MINRVDSQVEVVGDEAVNAEDHTTICCEEGPAYRRSNTEYAQREREAQRVSLIKNATVTKAIATTTFNNLYKGYKVTVKNLALVELSIRKRSERERERESI